MEKKLATASVDLKINEGILIGTYKKGLRINLIMAKEIVQNRLIFTKNKTLPALIYNQGVISMDREAREYLSSAEGIRGLKAAAIILDSPFGSFLGNFFLSVNKTKLPVKIFSSSNRAVKWLKQYMV
ncbi:MAG: hypothetical protein NVSMB45_16850 [Ginsengibacter sp.]